MPTLGAGVFYGPWSLTATCEMGQFTEAFVISGSHAADGFYIPADDGTPFQIAVDGERWAIDFQARFSDGDWFSYDPMRATAVVAPDGLTVTLYSEQILEPPGLGFVINHLLVMRLVSLDPEINPPLPQIPIDLSLPD